MQMDVIWRNLPYLFQGLALTLKISGMVIIGGLLLGILFGILRSSSIRLIRIIAAIYIESLLSQG